MARPKTVETKQPELTGGGDVLVACRVPMGLRLQLNEWCEVSEPGPAGPKTVRQSRRVGQVITVAGPSKSWFSPADSRTIDFDIEGGFATTLVPREFWELWFEQYKTSDLVRNRLIFAADPASAKAQCRELEKTRTGWEPVNPDDPQRRGGRDRLAVERADVNR